MGYNYGGPNGQSSKFYWQLLPKITEGLVEFFTIAAQWVSDDPIPQLFRVYVIYFKS